MANNYILVLVQQVSGCFQNYNYFADDPGFTYLIHQVENGIEGGVFPERITQGSSGTYIAKN